MSNVVLGNMYEINKNLMASAHKLSKQGWEDRLDKIMKTLKESQNQYFMLLCHEDRNYTIFNIQDNFSYKSMLKSLKECLENRGEVLEIELQDPNGFCYEIWIREKEKSEIFCYHLFPYDLGVIEIKEGRVKNFE